jgi:hypothetical protein
VGFRGTGSIPPSKRGLHLNILVKVKKDALKKPYILYDSRAYSEQEGVNLQAGGRIGEINFLYAKSRNIVNLFNTNILK